MCAVAVCVSAANSCGDSNHVCTLDTNISTDTNWVDGNTYVLLQDINVTGAGTDLNIAPGAVIKPLVNRSLIAIDSGRIIANGTADKNILFTSCKDQNTFAGSTNVDTSSISGCSGAPAAGNYSTGIWVKSTAAMTTSDSFSYLKIIDSTIGIELDQTIGSIHDSNFMFASDKGIYLTVASGLNLYNNSFSNLTSAN
ncbi:MAG: hypothetical protein Q7R47_00665, partial [Candidatus Diapherotrites archaeon]|nr:hypothetical protein [Candidatus Diapherotrites archaeon]